MPRAAPDTVTEMRVTLGTYERDRLNQIAEAYNRDKWLENTVPVVGTAAFATAGLVAAGGVGLAAYALYKWLGEGDIIESAQTLFKRAAFWTGGVVTDPFTTPTQKAVIKVAAGDFTSQGEIGEYFAKQYAENTRLMQENEKRKDEGGFGGIYESVKASLENDLKVLRRAEYAARYALYEAQKKAAAEGQNVVVETFPYTAPP